MTRTLYTLSELRALSPEQRAALMPSASAMIGRLLADAEDRLHTSQRTPRPVDAERDARTEAA